MSASDALPESQLVGQSSTTNGTIPMADPEWGWKYVMQWARDISVSVDSRVKCQIRHGAVYLYRVA